MLPSDSAPAAPWIDHREALDTWLEPIGSAAVVGLDTEFMRRNTFYPQLALLQLAHEGRYALIDPVTFPLGDALVLPSQHRGAALLSLVRSAAAAEHDLLGLLDLLMDGVVVGAEGGGVEEIAVRLLEPGR